MSATRRSHAVTLIYNKNLRHWNIYDGNNEEGSSPLLDIDDIRFWLHDVITMQIITVDIMLSSTSPNAEINGVSFNSMRKAMELPTFEAPEEPWETLKITDIYPEYELDNIYSAHSDISHYWKLQHEARKQL